MQTLPFFICEATYDQCLNDTGTSGQECRSEAVCGYEDPGSAAQAAIPAGSSISIGTTTIVGKATATAMATLAAAAESSSSKSGYLSPGAAAGLGVGCAIAGMLLGGVFMLLVRRRHAAEKEQVHNTGLGKADSGGLVDGDMEYVKPELSATAPRHELEGAKTSASISNSWSRTTHSNENGSG